MANNPVMARRINDLDDRDLAARIRIRQQLVAAREQAGLTCRQLGEKLHYEPANIRRLERQGVDQSYTVTVIRWARALGRDLVLEPVGFPPPRPPLAARHLTAMVAAAGIDADERRVARMVLCLAGIRVACAVTPAQLAERLGITPSAVGLFETSGASSALVALQRHARAVARCARRSNAYLAVHLSDTNPV